MPPSAWSFDCPSDESIARLVEGDLEGEQLAEMEHHLATCDRCPSIVGNLGRAVLDMSRAATVPAIDVACPPLPPETCVGRYVVRRSVGAGAMGRVYAAYDPTLDRQVALKLLHPGAGDAELEARLLREAKAMARLAHHPGVVPVYDAGTHGTQLFIAMEFVEGGTLRTWLATQPRTWREIVAVFQDAGRGLAHAHAAGLVHRDFKPDNVLVGYDGRVRVTDFGLARVVRDVEKSGLTSHAAKTPSFLPRDARPVVDASLTRTGALVGTPAYMAPEQLDGTDADARSDVFSFCVAFYEALHGERPFRGNSVAELRAAAVAERISPPRNRRSVPRSLGRALGLGLRARPEDRPASMKALLDDVARATRTSGARRMTVAAAWIAAAGVVVGTPLLLATHGAAPSEPAPAQSVRLSNAVAPIAALPDPSSAVEPVTAISSIPAAPTSRGPSAVAPLPVARPKAVTRPRPSAPAPSIPPKAPTVDNAHVVEGANGAPIIR